MTTTDELLEKRNTLYAQVQDFQAYINQLTQDLANAEDRLTDLLNEYDAINVTINKALRSHATPP